MPQEAERTVRAEFEGQAPGILYVADCHEESPYSSDEINRFQASVRILHVLRGETFNLAYKYDSSIFGLCPV